MAFTPTVTWSGGTSSSTGFNASPAGSADPRQGDDRIRELKVALAERLTREHFFALVGGSSAGQEGNLRAGAGRVYHQSSAPTTKPDGNTLDADDVGRLYCQSNTTPLRVRTSNSTWVGVAIETFRSSDGTSLLCKILDIGDWNMNVTASISVAHGLTLSKIRKISAIVRSDSGSYQVELAGAWSSGPTPYAGFYADGTNVVFKANTASNWAYAVEGVTGTSTSEWDATSYNRGWITIWYTA